ncbi:hypothetical protein [Pelomonas cellulosilytica]|uniref:Lipoprotein n=1 Tax=Pelomonas cellulosilytica TaxID=2906762 RepID=A0ABS8XUT9_9BURK|nr:hypothetical protein [Pelomonas sp. P8]MCE4555440.1 hypothetical protein [Pelomonas sp. P8]
MIISFSSPIRRSSAALLLALLAACGGGGGTEPPTTTPQPQPASALVVPVPPSASGDTVVQATYQPGVRELGTASGTPQLLQSDIDGGLQFSAAPGAQVGQVLIVAGRAYVVTAVDATGSRLSTRAPELGEVFASLRLKASMQDASAIPAPAGLARPMASATGSTSFAAELGSLGPVGVSYKGQLAMKLNLDLDFTAASGFKTFDLTGDLSFTQTLQLHLQTTAADGSTSKGLELARFRYVIPQTLGLAQVEVPVMLQAQASGDAKMEMRVIDGETRAHVALHYDPASGQLQSSNAIDSSAASQPPTGTPAPAKATTSLGLQLKVGPDLQLRLLETIAPLSASLRANFGVSGQVVSDGLHNCVGWKAELSLEAGAKLRRGSGDMQASGSTAPWPLGSGGDLAACQAPPATEPGPPPTPPTPGAAPVDGLALLPLPAGAEQLTGYQLVLAVDAVAPDVQTAFNVGTPCWQQPVFDLEAKPLETVQACAHTLQPQLRRADGSGVDVGSSDDWIVRFEGPSTPTCAADLQDPLLGLVRDGVPLTHKQGNFSTTVTYAIAPASMHANQFSAVCQLQITERLTGKRYVLRSPLWVAPAGRLMVSGPYGVLWTWWGN